MSINAWKQKSSLFLYHLLNFIARCNIIKRLGTKYPFFSQGNISIYLYICLEIGPGNGGPMTRLGRDLSMLPGVGEGARFWVLFQVNLKLSYLTSLNLKPFLMVTTKVLIQKMRTCF